MITLKELIDNNWNNLQDIEIIKMWFIINNKESEGLSIISDLSKSQLEKLTAKFNYIQTWLPVLPDIYKSNNGKIDRDTCDNLNQILKFHLLDIELNDVLLTWAKENIPKMKCPQIIFVPMINWLKEKYNIEFIKS